MNDLSFDMPHRPRRLRKSAAMRELVAEHRVHASQLVMPHFCLSAKSGREEIASMPGISRVGREELVADVGRDMQLGIKSVLLFSHARKGEKDATASAASLGSSGVPLAIAALKEAYGDELLVMTDVCLCAYTDHGHCGFLEGGRVANDPSLHQLAAMARAHAEAGADVVSPSDMMDGRVAAIREELDEHGLEDTAIMSYSVKYASAYYGPFREAADSAPSTAAGVPRDRKTYQMDPRNRWEARREAGLDEAEGADILMVKPGLAYLDVVNEVSRMTDLPVAIYNVSGEYSMVKAAAERGWVDEPSVVSENLHAFRRAGADILITYHAREALAGGWL